MGLLDDPLKPAADRDKWDLPYMAMPRSGLRPDPLVQGLRPDPLIRGLAPPLGVLTPPVGQTAPERLGPQGMVPPPPGVQTPPPGIRPDPLIQGLMPGPQSGLQQC
jgi:hypothetical protein